MIASLRAAVLGPWFATRDLFALAGDRALLSAAHSLRRVSVRRSGFADVFDARRHRIAPAALTPGDTPISVAIDLLRAARVSPSSHVFDPLAGRGAALLAARLLGARAAGFEIVAPLTEAAAPILARVDISLRNADARTEPYEAPTHVYLAWTCVSASDREAIAERLRALPPGVSVTALTWSLPKDAFDVVSQEQRWFPWGRVDVERAVRRPSGEGSCPAR